MDIYVCMYIFWVKKILGASWVEKTLNNVYIYMFSTTKTRDFKKILDFGVLAFAYFPTVRLWKNL